MTYFAVLTTYFGMWINHFSWKLFIKEIIFGQCFLVQVHWDTCGRGVCARCGSGRGWNVQGANVRAQSGGEPVFTVFAQGKFLYSNISISKVPDKESKFQGVVDYLTEVLDCLAKAEGIQTGGEGLSLSGISEYLDKYPERLRDSFFQTFPFSSRPVLSFPSIPSPSLSPRRTPWPRGHRNSGSR